ncbi:MAG: response regulator [Cyanobacteria bacterium P01_F01_bin.150]
MSIPPPQDNSAATPTSAQPSSPLEQLQLKQKELLECAVQLFTEHTEKSLSDLQTRLLSETLITRAKPKSYIQIAAETGYSGAYVRSVVAPNLWKTFSDILGTKVNRQNIRALLQNQLQGRDPDQDAEILPSPEPCRDNVNDVQAASNASAPCILIVDDQPHNLALLTRALENEDYEVWSTTSGADALKQVGLLMPDLIVLDVNMPGMTGYEVCQKLKADSHTRLIPVIFISALDEPFDKVQAFSVGGVDYITKPVNIIEALVRIDHHLQIGAIQTQLTSQHNPGQPPQSTQSPNKIPPEATLPNANTSIMVVDDDPRNLSLLSQWLEQEGYEVWQATTGRETLQFASNILPDLILLDINLPDTSGYEVCQQLRANDQTKRIPVIFVSVLNETWNKVKGFAVGGNDYLPKPLQILELHSRIRNQLQLQQLRARLSEGGPTLKVEQNER